MPPPWWGHLLAAFDQPGALMVEDLAKELGIDAESVEGELADSPLFHETEDGWVHLRHLAEGAVLTHQVTAREIAENRLDGADDLSLWLRFAVGSGWPLAVGGMLTADVRGGLRGPDGWLSGFSDGDVLGLRLSHGLFEVAPLRPGGATARPGAMARVVEESVGQAMLAVAVYAHFRDTDPGVRPVAPLDGVIADILHNYPGTFDLPHPPLTELLPEGGLVLGDGHAHMRGAPERAADVQGLSEDDVIRLVKVRHALSILSPDSDLTGTLRHIAVSDAVIGHLADDVARRPLPADMLAALLRAAADARQEAAVAFLAARQAGEPTEAATLVEHVLELAPGLASALRDAGFYAACRGDYAKADDLLRRGGVQSDEGLRPALRPLLSAPAGQTSRNQPCPCGSGRKYKACHQAAEAHGLPRRAPLLHLLILEYGSAPANRAAVEAAVAPGPAASATFLAETAVFEYGMAADFLAEYRGLLKADEAALVESWLPEPLRLWEVAEVDQAHGTVLLRALLGAPPAPGASPDGAPAGGGGPVRLRKRGLAHAVRAGDLLLARVLADGDGPRLLVDPPVLRDLPGLPPFTDPVDPPAVAAFLSRAANPQPLEPGLFL
ncbi:SEC-C motif-containing protein [Sinosporangium album]|uniref:SEC-C motif-containing protein n=2 Tax=Sinosporangium album TaxID=504805 RepID=A0A1G7SCL3_9ACTN|nr:SEC-C motif-containing protein [Sinosporangium album]